MKKNMRLKKSTKLSILALAVVVCIAIVWAVVGSMNNNSSESNHKDGEAQVIENEGDVEIIIPDDQESGGF